MIYTVTLNPSLDKTLAATGLDSEVINRAQVLRVDCGGKGINVSRALRNLGGESVALGVVGGLNGQRLQQGMMALGIRTDFVELAEETRVNLAIHDQARGALVKLNEAGPTLTADAQEALLERVRQRARTGDLWVLSGQLPPGAPEDLYATLVEIIQSAGGHACLDSSDVAFQRGCKAAPYLVKPNRAEAENLLGYPLATPQALQQALTAFVGMGTALVALSLGAEGALLADGQQAWWARPPHIEARSSIGAGDSLLAGLLWALTQGWPLTEAARWGVAAGTAAALEEGTGVCSREQTERLAPQVMVTPLSSIG